ncbi:chemotaxis protein CheW [Thiohalomonas denitrificans]|uniref:Twitching motility protein PilI n=1 Tax=Thiohalomonas denitrificans TaxID=415747 RepID=A0A1G5QJG3_9GAMM|nr:chemotaxis protein CheW [Thiohalomonas denitrificans]SCZ61842.1 twitching motility protein PilI [Thiohalomonas denitrificans]
MAADTEKTPFDLLRDIERRSRANARGLPEQVEIQTTWAGIGFRVGDAHLVAPLGVVREILTFPVLTRVPGAKVWMKGIANVRGNLLPVTDLKGLLVGKSTPMRQSARVLVVNNGTVSAGLLVDEVFGLRHFLDEDFSDSAEAVPEFIRRFINGIYRQNQEIWGHVNLHALVESDEFMHVAA